MSLENIITLKYQESKLHNLYLVQGSHVDQNHKLITWIEGLFSKILSSSQQKTSFYNHEDILFVPSPKKNYTVEDVEAIHKFLTYHATQLKNKFVIIPSAQCLTEVVINKLLKTLEQPEVATTFFILNPNKAPLIQTLISRSIQLRVPLERPEYPSHQIIKDIKNMEFTQFVDYVQKNNYQPITLCAALFDGLAQCKLPMRQYELIQEELSQLAEMNDFNSSQNSKLYMLFKGLTQLK